MLVLAARILLPMSQPAIQDGALLIDGSRIRAVGPRTLLKKAHPGLEWRDLGEAILLPGLVNVHTHLELSALRNQVPAGRSFVDWVLNLVEQKRGLTWDACSRATADGITELVRSGTTCVGEVTSTGVSFTELKASGLRGVVYREVIGPADARAEEIAEVSMSQMEAMCEQARGSSVEVGISPHAPYSVSPRLFQLCRRVQQRLDLKAAIHTAESSAEIEYLRSGTGEIGTRLLPATGWDDIPPPIMGTTPVGYLGSLGLLDSRSVIVHAVHLTENDLEMLSQGGAAVAHCPRSNAYLEVGRAPLKAFRDLKVPVGLGTDSLASSQTLSLWDEVRFAHEIHSGLLSPPEWIGMATTGGARALGLDREIGTLEPGKRADLIAVSLSTPEVDPYEYLLHEAGPERVLLTMVDGRLLCERRES